ncbi:MAG: tetratricopeptide repeat protein [Bradymonadales bacterium]|nr:tetratricopeptide repeat protein [Bradymonadales bacterium]
MKGTWFWHRGAVLLLALVGSSWFCCAGPAQQRSGEQDTAQQALLYEAYTLAQLARSRDDMETALAAARQAVGLRPIDAHLQLMLGEYLRWAGRSEEAVAALSRAVRQCAESMDLYLELAVNQELLGLNDDAERSYRLAVQENPDLLLPHAAYAQFSARHVGLERAVEILLAYLGQHPEDADGWRMMGDLYRALADWERALSALQTASRLEPENEGIYVVLIATARELGRADLAEQYAQECFLRHRQGVDCRIELIRTLDSGNLDPLVRHNRTFAILQVLSRAIGANLVRLRQVELQLTRELDATRAYLFLASIAVDRRRNSRIQSMTAWSAYRLGEAYLAIKYMRRVIDIRPRSAEALNFIGYSYAERGERLDEAEELIRAALEIWPMDGNIQDSLGWVFYQRGRYVEAVKWLYAAYLRVPDVAEIAEHLGDAWAALGEVERALEMYTRALETATDDRAADIQKKIDALPIEPTL